MTLIDRIMREVCNEMEWVDAKDTRTCSGKIRAKLALVASAYDAVVSAVRRIAEETGEDGQTPPSLGSLVELHGSLSALDEVRDE